MLLTGASRTVMVSESDFIVGRVEPLLTPYCMLHAPYPMLRWLRPHTIQGDSFCNIRLSSEDFSLISMSVKSHV